MGVIVKPLPEWATITGTRRMGRVFFGKGTGGDRETIEITVDPDVVYPLFLGMLGVNNVTQYWLEVCRRCFTTHLRDTLGQPFALHIPRGTERWVLRNHPAKGPHGKTADDGGAEFRTHYNRLKREGKV